MLVAALAAALLALPAGAAAKPQPKRACQAAAKAKKARCRPPEHSRGVERGHAAPAALRDDDGRRATRDGQVLEI
jgi:hypothetical protein